MPYARLLTMTATSFSRSTCSCTRITAALAWTGPVSNASGTWPQKGPLKRFWSVPGQARPPVREPQVVVVEELQRAGCEVVFLNYGLGESPEEKMLLQIQGVFAEYERALIQERTRRGRLFAARQGRVNWSHAPYGYRIIPKTQSTPQKLVVDETQAEVVRQ